MSDLDLICEHRISRRAAASRGKSGAAAARSTFTTFEGLAGRGGHARRLRVLWDGFRPVINARERPLRSGINAGISMGTGEPAAAGDLITRLLTV